MKKLFCIITVVLLLLGCLTMTVCATSDPSEGTNIADFGLEVSAPVISEDLQTLTMNGETFHRMDLSDLDYYLEEGYSLDLTESQKALVKRAMVYQDWEKMIAEVELYYRDGATLTLTFAADSRRAQLEQLLTGEDIEGLVEFYWPEDVIVSGPMGSFKENPVTLDSRVLDYCNEFQVFGSVEGLETRVLKGALLEEKGSLYYVEFKENDIDPNEFFPAKYTRLEGYEITDETLKSQLMECIESYYSDGSGMFYDDEFTEQLSAVILTVLFGAVPLGILALAVVLALRSKGYQRITWIVTSCLSGGALTVFIIIAQYLLRL